MTQDELDALTGAQTNTLGNNPYQQAIANQNQAANQYAQQAQLSNATWSGGYSQRMTLNSNGTLGIGTSPVWNLEEREREMVREAEREACAQLVIDMAEELGCPNLLHGVALAIKARRLK